MGFHKISKGLDLPLNGKPLQEIESVQSSGSVAIMGGDYQGMKPKLHVAVGDAVKRGQVLFTEKKCPSIYYTAPGAGVVSAINRGERRALVSVVIDLNDNEKSGQVGDAAGSYPRQFLSSFQRQGRLIR